LADKDFEIQTMIIGIRCSLDFVEKQKHGVASKLGAR
jgi:hypothetical protein